MNNKQNSPAIFGRNSVVGPSASMINFDQALPPSHPFCLKRAVCASCNRKICHECFNNHNCTINNTDDIEMKATEDARNTH